MKNTVLFVFSILSQFGIAEAQDMPEKFLCAYNAFKGDGLVIKELFLLDGKYVDSENPHLPYKIIGNTNPAYHLVHAAGGAITTIAIERSDGSMLKVSSATFGVVSWTRGKCSWQ